MRKLLVPMLGLWLGLGVSGRLLANEAGEHEHGQEVSMSDLPAPVKATFDKESKGGSVEELRKDTDKKGQPVYFGEVVKNGKGTELKVSESGKVLHRGKAHDESKEKGEKGETKPQQ
jgi:hypothetical protein